MTIGLLAVVVYVIPSLALAQPLTDARSMQLALDQVEFNQLLESRLEGARGQVSQSSVWPNPEFEISREGAGDEVETTLWFRQPIELSGRHQLELNSAEMNLQVVEASNALQRAKRASHIRQTFYQALYHQQQSHLLSRWVDRFTSVESQMRRREEAGDVSGYDRLRISRERSALLAQQRDSNAQFEAAWRQLIGLVDPQNRYAFTMVEGPLMPTELQDLSGLMQNLEQHPALTHLARQSAAASLNARSVSRSHIPDLTLGLGYKSIEGGGSDASGLMLNAAIDIPLFDRKHGQQQRARAAVIEIESEYRLADQRLRSELESLWVKAERLQQNARVFSEQNVPTSFELVEIAESSYGVNEIGVLELIDAYRSALDAQLSALRLTRDARMARVDLDALITGAML